MHADSNGGALKHKMTFVAKHLRGAAGPLPARAYLFKSGRIRVFLRNCTTKRAERAVNAGTDALSLSAVNLLTDKHFVWFREG
jgi:hypothetical protein